MQTIYFKKLVDEAKLPEFKTDHAVGADVYSIEDVVIEVGKRKIVGTGLECSDIPNNLEIQVRSRSGLAANNGVFVLNTPYGTIDPDYRGELKVILMNLGEEDFKISKGDRIAQIVACDVPLVNYKWNKKDSTKTERGVGGLGSTGK